MNKNGNENPISIQLSQSVCKGAESTQIGVQNNYVGLSPEQACNMALNLFKENFPNLQEEAIKQARERAEDYIKELVNELTKSGISNYDSLRDPDIQNALFDSEKGYALKGGDDLRVTLVKLMKSRFLENSSSILSVVLDEAIKTAPLLTERQKDLLALRFLIGETKKNNLKSIDMLITYLKQLASAFNGVELLTRTDLRHLDYCKCCHELLGKEFGCSIASNYKELLPLSSVIRDDLISSNQVMIKIDDRDLDIKSFLAEKCPEISKLMDAYDRGICHMMISSVGLVIGAVQAEIKLEQHYDLSLWVN